jgi:hypothetical protein
MAGGVPSASLATQSRLLYLSAGLRNPGGAPSDRICEASPEPCDGKPGIVLRHQLWHTTCHWVVMPLAALLYVAHREGCSLRTDTAATVSETEK